MFSALKRLTSRNNEPGVGFPAGNGLSTMSSSLQKKFAKGVQYNMKIILKGDRNSGKSSLFRRLQGLNFIEEYIPTDEIQVASIQWNYKTTDDVVKVEVWDVVDKAKKKKNLGNKLKINNGAGGGGDDGADEAVEAIGLDASFLDVYKGTNGVIFVFDITKNWTYDYVKREVSSVPHHIPILILGNHRDMGHHRATAGDTVNYFIESLYENGERDRNSDAEIRYAESSMRNGFGLKFIHKFFNLPFLQLQKETLLKQLETNRQENLVTAQELELYAESDDANYDMFIEGLSAKRRQIADAMSPPKIPLSEAQALANERALKEKAEAESKLTAKILPLINKEIPEVESQQKPPPNVEKALQQIVHNEAKKNSKTGSNSANGANEGNQSKQNDTKQLQKTNTQQPKQSEPKIKRPLDPIDDFMPDIEGKFDGFLDDQINYNEPKNNGLALDSSDEEGAVGTNPLVASYVDDFIPESFGKIEIARDDIKVSSDEEEVEEPQRQIPLKTIEPIDDDFFKGIPERKEEKPKKSHKKKHKKKERESQSLQDFLNGDDEAGVKEEGAYEEL